MTPEQLRRSSHNGDSTTDRTIKKWMAQNSLQIISNCNSPGSGRSDGAELDVREFHCGTCLVNLHIFWGTGVSAAWTTVRARLAAVHRVSGVQPEHVCVVVIPQRHDKHNTCVDGLLHSVPH